MNSKKANDFFRGKRVLVIGANSDIARQCILALSLYGSRLTLAARDIEALNYFMLKNQIEASTLYLNLDDPFLLDDIVSSIQTVDGVIFAAGYLPENNTDTQMIEHTIKRNYWSCIVFLERMLIYKKISPHGFISVISSIGGERGKASNRTYASAKAGLTCYLEGLTQELTPFDIRLTIVKPAYVKTKMTCGQPAYSSKIAQTPEIVSAKMISGIMKRKNGALYTGYIAWGIALVMRFIPSFFYSQLRL